VKKIPFEQTKMGSIPVLAGILALVTLLLYFPPRDAEFVYDSLIQIHSHGFIHDSTNWWPTITFQVMAWDVLDFNRPVHLASLMADSALWGRSVFGYRLTSAILHTSITVLLFAFLVGFVKSPEKAPAYSKRVAFAAALLFGIHPLLTEAVCEPSYREDLLAAFFCILALILAQNYHPGKRGTLALLALCPLAALLGAGSKESAIAIPFVLVVYWAVCRRGEPSTPWLVMLTMCFLATGGFITARFLLETQDSRIFTESPDYPGGSFGSAMLLLPRILTLYLFNILWPVNLCADYGAHSLRHLSLPLSLLLLVALFSFSGWLAWKDRRAWIPLILIAISMAPVMNFIPMYRAAADRFLYLPLLGVAMIVSLLLDRWLAGRGKYRFPLAVLVMLFVTLAYGTMNWQRQQVWKTNLALWEDTLTRNPRSYNAAAGLGTARMHAGMLQEAEAAYAHALQLTDGKSGDLWGAIAVLMARQGRTHDAMEALRLAVEYNPRIANPADMAETMHMTPDAAADIQKLLDLAAEKNKQP
jgi:tetratricopeptide (TPR) repeat protein